jgi:hypothetical protein
VVQTTQKSASDRPAKAPLSAHPLFGAVVALWFAALLGLGSAVLPGRVVEPLVGASGLPAVLPAAAPPLGFTARILIAVAASGLGVLIGLFIARRIAAAQRPGQNAGGSLAALFGRRKKAVRPPLSIRDALGEDAAAAAPARRRTLAIAGEQTADSETAWPVTDAHADDPLPDAAPLEAHAVYDAVYEAEPFEEQAATFDEPGEWPAEWDQSEDESPASATVEAEDEPVLPPAHPIADRAYDPAPAFAAPADVPLPAFSAAQERAESARIAAPLPIMQRPLDQLGMTELVERLAHAIQDRQVRNRAADAPRGEDQAEPAAMPVPAALRPVAFDSGDGYEDGHDDEDYGFGPFALPLGRQTDSFAPPPAQERKPFSTAALTPASPDESDEDEDESDADDGAGYSSLLDLQKPFLPRDAADGEDDAEQGPAPDAPAAFHPGAAPLRTSHETAVDTEQALRDALANLQRISGAA